MGHRVGIITEVPQVLRELGIDPAPVLARAGVDPAVLATTENRMPFAQMGNLLRVCVEETGLAHFGLLVGGRARADVLGLVGRLMRTAPTLKDAILDLCTNQHRYIRGAVSYLTLNEGAAFWGYAVQQPNVAAIEVMSDTALALGFNLVRELTGLMPENVLLSRLPPEDIRPYRRLFGVTPQFDAEQSALTFPARQLAQPVCMADPLLRQILQRSVASYWAVEEPSVADHVARILRARVVFPDISLEEVAQLMAMHPRTLNRRLRDEGTNFRALLIQTRTEVAQQWLRGTRMNITDIALALGYSEVSGFSRAFQRQTGTAPTDWRALPEEAA